MSDARAAALERYRLSVLKQKKFGALRRLVEPLKNERCLDLGSEDGVMSLLLRSLGGTWRSADLHADAVAKIRGVVDGPAELLDGPALPYEDGSFDLVAIVDMLEHLEDDRRLIAEAARVLVPGGRLVVNVPHDRPHSGLRWLRLRLGLTDKDHGHVRAGYTSQSLRRILDGLFQVEDSRTYVGPCTELVDILVNWHLRRRRATNTAPHESGERTTQPQRSAAGSTRAERVAYPILKGFSLLDRVIPTRSGAMLILSARQV